MTTLNLNNNTDEDSDLESSNTNQISFISESENEVTMIYKNLPLGFGITIGNALRRSIFASVKGCAIASVRINGINHEFPSIPGMKEDCTSLIMNMRSLIIKRDNCNLDKIYKVKATGPIIVTGSLFNFPGELEILNKDHYICSLSAGSLEIEFIPKIGVRYVPADSDTSAIENKMLPLDRKFNPILNVKYNVSENLDNETLYLSVKTNGSVDPVTAIREALNNIMSYLINISPDSLKIEEDISVETAASNSSNKRDLLSKIIDDPSLGFGKRSRNALKAKQIRTLQDLVNLTSNELKLMRNVGKTTIQEIDDILSKLGLSLAED